MTGPENTQQPYEGPDPSDPANEPYFAEDAPEQLEALGYIREAEALRRVREELSS